MAGRNVVVSRGGGWPGSAVACMPRIPGRVTRCGSGRGRTACGRLGARTADPGVYSEIILTDGNQPGVPSSRWPSPGQARRRSGQPTLCCSLGGSPESAWRAPRLSRARARRSGSSVLPTRPGIRRPGRPATAARCRSVRRLRAHRRHRCDRGSRGGRLEERLGPVTALVHTSEMNSPRRFADLTADDFLDQLRPMTAGLASALAAVRPGKLRLIVTFGSVAGTYGLARRVP